MKLCCRRAGGCCNGGDRAVGDEKCIGLVLGRADRRLLRGDDVGCGCHGRDPRDVRRG